MYRPPGNFSTPLKISQPPTSENPPPPPENISTSLEKNLNPKKYVNN